MVPSVRLQLSTYVYVRQNILGSQVNQNTPMQLLDPDNNAMTHNVLNTAMPNILITHNMTKFTLRIVASHKCKERREYLN